MDYKLIALDIDGTLTNSQKEITPRTRYALMEAQKQGKKIILASGRHPVGIMPIAKTLCLTVSAVLLWRSTAAGLSIAKQAKLW